MPGSINDLIRTLIGQRLIRREQADDALASRPATIEKLLEVMERKQYLTSYQTGRILRGETKGLVLGHYKLLYRNASGSFARVFRAASLIDNSMVALKLLRERWSKDPETVRSFRREAKVCMRFKHRNIVPIYEVGDDRDFHYFTMEFVEGGNLRDFIRIRRKLSPIEGARCLLDICNGLQYALGLGVTHRDLKLTNVLMSSKGVAKLVDFGLAGDDVWSGRLDGDGEQRALEYAALERGSNAPRSDPRSDIFFAGAILYELISGQPAWPRTRNREERKQFSRYVNVRPLPTIDRNLPPSLTRVVDRMMKVSADARYQTPAEVVADLQHTVVELGGAGTAPDQIRSNGRPIDQEQTTILCVETRPKHQDVLREYFTNRGYRLLLTTDYVRAKSRLTSPNPPDALVVMAGAMPDPAGVCRDQKLLEQTSSLPVFVVLSQKQAAELESSGFVVNDKRLLVQPVNLKRLRLTIDQVVARD